MAITAKSTLKGHQVPYNILDFQSFFKNSNKAINT